VVLFNDELLTAIGAWQKGWREDQSRREELAERLVAAAAGLPREFRTAGECFRKRFLLKGELVDIVLRDEKHEGVTSWTLDERFAERFKGLSCDLCPSPCRGRSRSEHRCALATRGLRCCSRVVRGPRRRNGTCPTELPRTSR
jgi:hypothetical protein